jgi:hypothetical protein
MKIKLILKKIIFPISLLAFLWVIALLTKFTSEKEISTFTSTLPNNTSLAVKIDTKSIFKESVFELLFEAKDQEVLDNMKTKLSEPSDIEGSLGIDFISEASAFVIPFENTNVKGLSIHLKDISNFQKNIPLLVSKKSFTHTIDNIGYIFNSTRILSEKEIENFKRLAFDKKQNKNNLEINVEKSNSSDATFISKGNSLGKNTIFASSEIYLNTLKNSITTEGKLLKSKNKSNSINNIDFQIIKSEKLFRFSSGIIPISIQDTLSHFIKKTGLNLPKIKAISFNYEGLEMMESIMLPNLNMIIQFHDSLLVSEFLSNQTLLSKLEATSFENTISIEGKKYHFNQLSPFTISIGTDEKVEYTKAKNIVLEANGNLSALFEIKNGGMFVSFLEGIPVFKGPKTLFNASKGFNLKIEGSTNEFELNGALEFKEGHYTMNELSKFLLEIQSIF